MSLGSTETIYALPPNRHGLYSYEWEYKLFYDPFRNSSWTSLTQDRGGWVADFAMPNDSDIEYVKFKVTLDELSYAHVDSVISGYNNYVEYHTVWNDALPKTSVSIESNPGELPLEFSLEENYPNPFNPSTEIQFSVPQSTHVRLIVVDVSGRIVATLVDQQLGAGEYRQAWDATSSPSGIYLYRMETPEFSSTKKMILLK